MLKIGALILVLWLGASTAHSLNATTAAASSLSTSSILACPARTINYITHTLPQQCLRTSRSTLISAPNASLSDAGPQTSTSDGPAYEEVSPLNETSTTEGGSPSHSKLSHVEEASITTRSASTQPSPPTESLDPASTDLGPDSPLDDSKFLSFEEWKKQNLAKLGQSPDNVGQGRGTANAEGRRRPINNALDSLGDDGEIEIDFSGFGGGRSEDSASGRMASGPTEVSDPPPSESPAATAKHRSKDAGKTCKERFNYASFDCAATILKTNSKCKSSSSVLMENKDSYMLNECSSNNKFLIIELCDDILVDTIVLANYEFFSSMFRTVRVSVSDRYPVKTDKWKELGTFEARNTRDVQAFLVENPLIWARYLRIEFLTHYGNEFYCPVSLVRVHGTTMMEEVRRSQEDGSRSDDDVDEETTETEVESPPQGTQIADEPQITFATVATSKDSVETDSANETLILLEADMLANNLTEQAGPEIANLQFADVGSSTEANSTKTGNLTTRGGPHKISALLGSSKSTTQSQTAARSDIKKFDSSQTSSVPVQGPETGPVKPTTSSVASHASPADSRSSEAGSQSSAKVESKSMRASAESTKPSPSTSQAQPPQPTTQESFFKSTSKRLAMLETNSSLNIQYIEEQSRILRDAFIQTEKQQLRKTENFLSHLNDTVMAELKGFRQQYDQLWQSTVIELETHREQYQREMLAISSRLTIMADELVFQKRMIVVQSTLLLLCLGLIIFVRSGSSYMELPLMQQMMNKSHSVLKLSFDSPPESPSSRRTSPLRNARRLARTSSGTSEGSQGSPSPDRHNNPSLRFSPPTPSDAGRSERDKSPSLSPEESHTLRETRSGPATPSGTRENQQIEWDTPLSIANDSPLLKPRRSDLQAQDSQRSSLRYSGSSDFDEDVNVNESTTERLDRSATKAIRRKSHRTNASSGDSMSSFDGDTAAELMFADGLSDSD
jgi:hypothetical protein